MKIILCVVFLTFAGLTLADDINITTEFYKNNVLVNTNCKAIIEEDPKLTINELLTDKNNYLWQPCENIKFSRGYTSEVAWIHLPLKNSKTSPTELYLESPIPWVSDIRLYRKTTDEKFVEIKYGSNILFSEKNILTTGIFIPIILEPLKSEDIYLRFSTNSTLSVGLELFSKEAFEVRRIFITMFNGFLLGGLVMLLIYNLSIYVSLRDKNYRNYVLYIITMILFCGTVYGYSYQLFWPQQPDFNFNMNSATTLIGGIVILFFASRFLEAPVHLPKLYKLGQYLAVAGLISLILVFSSISHVITNGIATVVGSLIATLVLIIGIISLKLKVPASGYFILAWSFSLTGIFIISLINNGTIEYSHFAYYSLGIGILLEMSFLSLALAWRIKGIQDEKETTHRLYESTLENAKIELEQKVTERTIELEKSRDIAEKIALTDMLSGLNNRRAIFELGNELFILASNNKTELSVIMLDIDNFKVINDNYGHATGDKVIQTLSDKLQNFLRTTDVCGRIGGEEFILLLPGVKSDSASVLANRLREEIFNISLSIDETNISFSASFGVTSITPDVVSFDALVAQSDIALYEAKNSGRNLVCVFKG